MKKGLDVWTSRGLLSHIRNLDKDRPDRRLVFILGAGASVNSGIPSGQRLVERWLVELHECLCHGTESVQEWATSDSLGIPGFEYARRAEFYPQVFERRYRRDPSEGYEALEKIMDLAKPSFGYSVLAQIMATTRHNAIVTTNFDNLVADAMATYSGRHPLMVGHESLAGYARARLSRPLVAKIHRDLFMDPINDQAGTSELATGWETALSELFKHHTPIVIGYGGNDGSLMGFLENLSGDHIPGGLFWTYREGSGRPEGRIAKVVTHHSGVLVPVIGFDEFMLQLREVFELDDLTEHISKQAEDHLKRYKEQADKLLKAIDASGRQASQSTSEQTAVRQAAESLAKQQHSWMQWALRAWAEPDPLKQEAIYREGLAQLPDNPELTGNFALFMTDIRKDYDEAERLYQRALELDPNVANHTGNFALFMADIRRNYDEAERLYRRALELDPNDANHTGNFANFMMAVRKDYDEAERLYRRALELDPNDANHTGNFALFMADIRRDYDEAERLYRRALELDPNVANHTGNFASFIKNVRKDYDEAERLFRRALELDPNHANNTGNFALFMADIRRDYDEAERLYRRALELDPNHANNTSNFAEFLLLRGDTNGAIVQAKRALQLTDESDGSLAGPLTFIAALAADDTGTDATPALARLKPVLQAGKIHPTWSFDSLLTHANQVLDEETAQFYRALADVIQGKEDLSTLDAIPRWHQVAPADPASMANWD